MRLLQRPDWLSFVIKILSYFQSNLLLLVVLFWVQISWNIYTTAFRILFHGTLVFWRNMSAFFFFFVRRDKSYVFQLCEQELLCAGSNSGTHQRVPEKATMSFVNALCNAICEILPPTSKRTRTERIDFPYQNLASCSSPVTAWIQLSKSQN